VGKQEVGTSAPFDGTELANHHQQTPVAWRVGALCGLLAAILPHFPGRPNLPVPFRMDVLLSPRHHVLRSDAAAARFRRMLLYGSTYPLPDAGHHRATAFSGTKTVFVP